MINLSKLAAIARAKPKAVPVASENQDQEKLSRRAALRRIGMTSGIAFVGLLTIDDLARVASRKLEQNELTRGIAKDFKSAGVAFATSGLPSPSVLDLGVLPTIGLADCVTRANVWYNACRGICDIRYPNHLSTSYIDCMRGCRRGWKTRQDGCV